MGFIYCPVIFHDAALATLILSFVIDYKLDILSILLSKSSDL